MTPSLLSILAALFWIIAGPVATLAAFNLLLQGWLDRDKRTTRAGLKLLTLGLTVCTVFYLWHNATLGA